MKSTILNIYAFILLFTLMGVGCKKTKEIDENQLIYKKCPCEYVAEFVKKVVYEKVLLFDASKTSFQKMKDLTFDGNQSLFICYLPDTGRITDYMYLKNGPMGASYICNVPSFTKKWVIPTEGTYVNYTTDMFSLCNNLNLENYLSTIVLTSFTKE